MNKEHNYKILVINPGSTSTAISVFQGEEELFQKTIRHSLDELKKYEKLMDQYPFREQVILKSLEENNISLDEFDAIVGRGGILSPLASGTYYINQAMLEELRERPRVEHASNLAAQIATKLPKK